MGETSKAYSRRLKSGWFDNYLQLPGIDIGGHEDPLQQGFFVWDLLRGHGDATLMTGVPNEQYQTVYASHILEHIKNYELALRSWYRICKPNGLIIICVPHRDLYEKKENPPSRYNEEHCWFWVKEEHLNDNVLGLKQAVQESLEGLSYSEVLLEIRDEGFEQNGLNHSKGEYSIEMIIRKEESL